MQSVAQARIDFIRARTMCCPSTGWMRWRTRPVAKKGCSPFASADMPLLPPTFRAAHWGM